MLAELSRSELGLWAALWQVDPWDPQRADRRAAIGHALYANSNRDSQKRPQPYKVEDFMPYLDRAPDEIAREVAESLVHSLAKLSGDRKAWDKSAWRARRREMGKAK